MVSVQQNNLSKDMIGDGKVPSLSPMATLDTQMPDLAAI